MKLIACLAILPITAAAIAGDYIGDLLLQAQVAQTEYLCDTGHEASCRKLALWTGGQCASPRQIGGCSHDSYIRVGRFSE